MVSIDKRSSGDYDKDEIAGAPVEMEENLTFEDIEKDPTLFFMMYVPKNANATEFLLFTDEAGQPILVVKETSKEIASKIAKKFMLLRPGSILYQQK